MVGIKEKAEVAARPATMIPLCPSAQPEMLGSVVFGVASGTAAAPRVAYLDRPVPVTPDVLPRLARAGLACTLTARRAGS